MIAILLCAGFGTRMYPLTEHIAKALLPVAERPVLDYLMDQLLEMDGLEEIHLVANNRFFSQFESWQEGIQSRLDAASIRLVLYNDGVNDNHERLGAVGDLDFVLNKGDLWNKPALVLAGDNIFLFDLVPLWNQFVQEKKNRILGIVENELRVLQRTGIITVAENGRVIDFEEKPEDPPTNIFSPPVYFLLPEALKKIRSYNQSGHSLDAIGNFVRYLVRDDEIYAFTVEGKRLDIGSMADYEQAGKILEGKDW